MDDASLGRAVEDAVGSRTAACASSATPDAAVRAVFTAVRASLRTALLRSRAASVWRQRLSADFECANGGYLQRPRVL